MSGPEECFADVGRGVTLCYDQVGDADDPMIVLIPGLGQQLHSWHIELAETLADKGFSVMRIDNRDSGRSTHMDYRPPKPLAMLRGGDHPRQYHLGDMARDTVGLLDVLGRREAHLVGVSMGGMIAQTVAAHYPGRVTTLTSIMSTTGGWRTGRPALSTMRRMLSARPALTRAEAMDRAESMFRHIGSHGFPFDKDHVRDIAADNWDRDPKAAAGIARQMAAITGSGDRSAELRHIDVPTLVIHGDRDRMVHPTGGASTARAIRGARLESISGLGHDLPRPLWPTLVEMIARHAGRTTPSEAS